MNILWLYEQKYCYTKVSNKNCANEINVNCDVVQYLLVEQFTLPAHMQCCKGAATTSHNLELRMMNLRGCQVN